MPKTPNERLEEHNEYAARFGTNEVMSLGTQEGMIAMMLAVQLERIIIALEDVAFQMEKSRGRMP